MGVETELLGIKNRYDGKEFRVIEREDGTIAVLAGDTVIVDSGVTPVTATPSSGGFDKAAVGDDVFGLPCLYPLYQSIEGVPSEFECTVMAALQAGATASQSGTTVTVACGAAHNIAATENGARFFYPGSASIPQGIYSNLQRVDANNLTFQRAASETVESESVNSGAAFTAIGTIAARNVKGGRLGKKGRLSLCTQRGGGAIGSATVRLAIGGSVIHVHTTSTAPYAELRQTMRNRDSETRQIGLGQADGVLTSTAPNALTIDTTIDQLAALSGQLSAAGGVLIIYSAEIEIARK
jgi:hypothetical protein